jgi:hypothetical protein
MCIRDRKRLDQRTAQLLGRLRVLEADSGAADGSFRALETGIAIDADLNRNIIEDNRVNRNIGISSQYTARSQELQSRYNPLVLSAAQGGLQGFGAGLQIISGIDEIKRAQEAAAAAGQS